MCSGCPQLQSFETHKESKKTEKLRLNMRLEIICPYESRTLLNSKIKKWIKSNMIQNIEEEKTVYSKLKQTRGFRLLEIKPQYLFHQICHI
jgi:hypothetical protein